MEISIANLAPSYLPACVAQNSRVWGQDLVFETPKKYLIRSASGRGKSSFLHLLFGLHHDYKGDIRMNGQLVQAWSWRDWTTVRTQQLSLVFQGTKLFAHLNAWQNLQIKNQLTHTYTADELAHLLDRLGCTGLNDRPVSQLSYGQRQRIGIIRALCQPFAFLLLDEPFSHLDQATYEIAIRIIEEACEARGAGLILTSLGPTYGIDFDQSYQM